MILDGKKVRDDIINNVKNVVEKEKLDITLAIVFVGNNPASEIYVRNKIKYAEKCGIKTLVIRMSEDTSYNEIEREIIKLNNDDKITGIIIQLPLPHKEDEVIINIVNPSKDVDGFTPQNKMALENNIDGIYPCTPLGIMRLLEYYNIDVNGKNVCILGRGKLVGAPIAMMMRNKGANVTVCHSKTVNEKEETLKADIIICAVGKAHLLTEDMVKDGAVVVDAGISFVDGVQYGDADFDTLKDKCLYITPNPGGVGPMTVSQIMENLVRIKKGRK